MMLKQVCKFSRPEEINNMTVVKSCDQLWSKKDYFENVLKRLKNEIKFVRYNFHVCK
jgi:hypothetical protein